MITREKLELGVPIKKLQEVHKWFEEHFVSSSHKEYISRCPFLIIQGPTSCGKTTALRSAAKKVRIPVREFSETTDTTYLNIDVAHALEGQDREATLSATIERRKVVKFEQFVINSLRYSPLYPANEEPGPPSADSEFDTDDEFDAKLDKTPPRPKGGGVIIHLETPLSFAQNQRILIHSIIRLTKNIREISKSIQRRVAIVFEHLDCEKQCISLPTKLKTTLGMQTIKFNPVTRLNMKKFAESLIEAEKISITRDELELLISSSDGDMGACINTLLLCRNKQTSVTNGVMTERYGNMSIKNRQPNKKQRLDFEMICSRNQDKISELDSQLLRLCPDLVRDCTKSSGFFHTLGKIFYQKRLYPDGLQLPAKSVIDRPYALQNNTEVIANYLGISAKTLLTWLHQHYHRFCGKSNVEKAALFLEYLSDVDTMCISSTQSSQFYEAHSLLDQVQLHVSIDSTTFCLYEDKSESTPTKKRLNRKNSTGSESFILRSSVECNQSESKGDIQGFKKPDVTTISRLAEDNQIILNTCIDRMNGRRLIDCRDSSKVLLDYIPYINWIHASDMSSLSLPDGTTDMLKSLSQFDLNSEKDYNFQHEKLLELIDSCEI